MSDKKETTEQTVYRPMEKNSAEEPQARIQKIHQEGSKNTYVIIVNKDCLKSDSALKSLVKTKAPVSRQVQPTSHGRIIPRRSLLQSSDLKKNLTTISDREFDSPTDTCVAVPARSLLKSRPTSEAVKLNLSHIDDEEYDSGLSSSSVFLKSEESNSAFDSAIETDASQNSSFEPYTKSLLGNSGKTKMNSYVIPSPLTSQQSKSDETQHIFQVVNPKPPSTLAYSTPLSTDKTVAHPTARKIVLVQDSNTSTETVKNLRKTVHYTSQAVPLAHKHLGTPVSIGYQRPINPNAVPVFSDISPVQTGGDNKFSPLSMGTFVPVAPSPKTYCAGDNKGPFTSTPIDTYPRIAHLKQESSTHRPVYIIQPPFKKKSDLSSSNTNTGPKNTAKLEPIQTTYSDLSDSGFGNNSSGFISASDSLEKAENTSYIQIIDVRSLSGSKDEEDLNDVKRESFGQSSSVEDPTSAAAGSVRSESQSQELKFEIGDLEDTGLGLESKAITSSQESESGGIVIEKGCLNQSLTNIQWLKGMKLKEKVSTSTSSSIESKEEKQIIQWKCLTPEDIKKISEECGRDRRPPFSYMAMIQMALYSREDRRMTLKEIIKWIEETFPYYRATGKQGWKNSIRHNLSLYNIFEREPKKRHGAYWTIKPDLEPKTKQYKDNKDRYKDTGNSLPDIPLSVPSLPSQTPGMIPIIPMYSSMGQLSAISPQSLLAKPQTTTANRSKKGPQPILPRPGPYGAMSPYAPQAYALIPLQSMSQSYSASQGIPQSPVILNLPTPGQTMSACPSPVISEMSAAVASIQVSCASPIPESFDSQSSNESVIPSQPINFVKQAWIESQNMETYSSLDSDLTSSNDIASSNEFYGKSITRPKVKRPRDGKPTLPKPKIYKQEKGSKNVKGGSKRRKLQRERALQESSDEEDAGTKFLSDIQKGLDTPTKLPVSTDEIANELLSTSTPLKGQDNGASPELLSPIQGLTPLRTAGLFDGSFLDLIDKKAMSPDLEAKKYSPDSQMKLSPNTSLDFNMLDKCSDSPDSNNSFSNHNLSRFLNEYCCDPNLADSPENFPSLNWSIVQQMVDNMDMDQN